VTVALREMVVAELERERRFLQPGHLIISPEPVAITTILGSCVAVCLWDANRGVGGMNHFMLPIPVAGHVASARFGNVAMQQLVDGVKAFGGRRPSLRAKVFGGASMFPIAGTNGRNHLGVQNGEVAVAFLRRAGIAIVERDLGGTRGRKVIFHTDEGTSCLTLI